MKLIGEYTVRGTFQTSAADVEKIILFDGDFETAYRVTRFDISFQNRSASGTEVASAKLTTVPDGVGDNRDWHWDSNTEIAWATCAADSNGLSTQKPVGIVDPDNLIVEDLYVGGYSYTDAETINYMIHLEKYDVSEYQGALAMVRNRSQT